MKKILTLLLCTVMLCACSDDDDNANGNSNLNGSWNMDTYTAFMDVLPVLEEGDITWTFTNNGATLTVNNTVQDEYPYMLASGTYSVIAQSNYVSINVAEGEFQKYDYTVNNGILVLTDTNESGDGPVIQFSMN
ncbi:hypothetical protein GR160_16605 [Flavobacterium sp. Sd200]|uniref:hypothetical protein n=1 Tax=Flavobacterium sp. Sd200 TaxID=2692211 RepID=UPI00136FBBFB|nr:hypothetical protein [Flavobacterium sp. Sd200]MXN92850.1 hypothetical protein [Flavobacterium sp. Sd200]